MAYRWIALLICAVAALAPAHAMACLCPPGMTAADFANRADAIFRGRVLSVSRPDRFSCGEAGHWERARFQVITLWKGSATPEAVVLTAGLGSSCGFPLRPGTEYLVFASRTPEGSLHIQACDGTREHFESSEELKYVQQHFPVIDVSKPQPSESTSSCASMPVGGLLPALMLLAFRLRRR
jgi:hypothetical protein